MKLLLKIGTLVCVLFGLWAPLVATAAPIYSIAIANANVAPNGSGEILVTLSGTGESTNLVGYEFRITPMGGASSQLKFLQETEEFLSDANYVFSGNSAAANDAVLSSVGTVTTTVLPNDTFIGGDSSDDFANVPVAGTKLLVKIPVQHSVGPADPQTTVGHQFSVSLVPTSGDSSAFGGGTSNTGFLDSVQTGVAFESQSGIVTIIVPEPAVCVSFILTATSLLFRRNAVFRLRISRQ